MLDPGPHLEFERAVGTQRIVAKAQKLLYVEEAPPSDSSDEVFQFSLPEKKEKKLKKAKLKERKVIAHKRRNGDREKLKLHRQRFGGCGVFKKGPEANGADLETPKLSQISPDASVERSIENTQNSMGTGTESSISDGGDGGLTL